MTRAALAVLLLTAAILTASAVRPVWTIDPDASLYLGLGRALAAGDGYSLDAVPHGKYPPGFPALLATLAWLLGPEAYAAFHLAQVGLLIGAVWLTCLLIRRLGYGAAVALAIAAVTAASQTLFDLSVVYLRSEILFLAVTLAALLMLQRALDPETGGPAAVLGAAALCIAAMSVRLAGVALLAIPMLAIAVPAAAPPARRGVRIRALAIAALAGAALVAWQARGQAIAHAWPEAPDYAAEFRAMEPRDLTKTVQVDMQPIDGAGMIRRVVGNLEVLARATAVLLTNVDRAGSRLPVGVLLLALVFVGVTELLRPHPLQARRRQAAAYFVAMIGLCLVWPFNQQERFYVPVLPLFLLAAGSGACRVFELAHRLTLRSAGRQLVLAAGAALLLLLAWQRSDHPTLLGRWSLSYAALLAVAAAAWLAALLALRHGPFPARPPSLLLVAAPLLLALPWLHHRFIEWPKLVRTFDEHRAANPQPGALARIDVDPRLESVAVFLRDETPVDSVVMTDVPAMLQIMSERRCIPFVYQVHPPEVRTGVADLVFYSREIPEASAVMDAVAPQLQPVFTLPAVDEGGRSVIPAVFRTR